MELVGRRTLVTGASSGIGREISILLSRLGAQTVLVGRDKDRLDATASLLSGSGHRVEPFDLNAVEEIPAWLSSLAEDGRALHGLVHSAGIHSLLPLRSLKPASIEQVMRVNLTAAAMLAKGFRQKRCNAGGGSIVFLASVAGLAGSPGIAAYSASKAALIGLTKSLAVELAGEAIRVNCVAPGFVRTPMLDRLQSSLTAEQFAEIESMHPLGVGTVRDVANAVAFLLAGAARWITGTTLVVDGGYTAR